MSDEEDNEALSPTISYHQKKEIAKWFLLNSPAGEIKYVAKDVKVVIDDDEVYDDAAAEAFPVFNKTHMICLEMPRRSGFILVSEFGEISENEYLDPRMMQVATVDHVKQVCTGVRDATDDELPSPYIEDFRSLKSQVSTTFSELTQKIVVFCNNMNLLYWMTMFLHAIEMLKYVEDVYPKGVCSIYCTNQNNVEEPGSDFELVAVISVSRLSPQNFCNGSWRSVWHIEFKDDIQAVEIGGKLQVGAHYFEEGNVQLDSEKECRDSTVIQSPEDSAISITNIIRHHEAEYLNALEVSYTNLPDTTFKDLRRKLPVTRTLFPWHNTLQFSLTRDIKKELGIGK